MKPLVLTLAAALAAIAMQSATAAAVSATSLLEPLGPTSLITFDTADSDTIAELPALGVTIHSLDLTAAPFISGTGGPGIGTLTSNAFGNARQPVASDISDSPFFDKSTLRAFEVVFAQPVQSFALDVIGWGGVAINHTVTVFGAQDQTLGTFTFSELGLVPNDNAANSRFGIVGNGSGIARFAIAPSYPTATTRDFVVFDNLRVGAVVSPPVPEPGTWAMLALGLATLGLARRRR